MHASESAITPEINVRAQYRPDCRNRSDGAPDNAGHGVNAMERFAAATRPGVYLNGPAEYFNIGSVISAMPCR